MRQHLVRIVLGVLLVLVAFLHASRNYPLALLDRLDTVIYDERLLLTMPKSVGQDVVILDIDEKSLREMGQWPWCRDKLAELMDALFDRYGIAILGFDIVFAERDNCTGLTVLNKLAQTELKDVPEFKQLLSGSLSTKLDYDRRFAASLKNRRVVLGFFFGNLDGNEKPVGALPAPVLPSGMFKGKNVDTLKYGGYGANLPELQGAAQLAGHFNPFLDPDGVVRRVPLIAEYGGAFYESLSLAIFRKLIDSPQIEPQFEPVPGWAKRYSGLEHLQLGKWRIPIDDQMRMLIPYRGHEGSFKYISAADVFSGKAAVNDLKGKVVIMGTTAQGLKDLRSTPVGGAYPGVEIHATLVQAMMDGNFKKQPGYVIGAEILLVVILGLALSGILPFITPVRSALVVLLAIGLVLGLSMMVWKEGVAMPTAAALCMTVGLFVLNMSLGYFLEFRAKQQITDLFGQYVPPKLVDEISKQPELVSMEGVSKDLSVLFSDVRGFTTISEALDPKALSRLMNAFLTPLTLVVYQHRGTIDKYMGDCIMAFWGAPLDDADHARNAVLAGLEMQRRIKELQPEFKKNGWPPITIGVGVNSGAMSVGNMGSEMRRAYTVMGDSVNLASRLEGLTKEYGVGMLVGEGTRNMVKDFVFRELDRVKAKGKAEPVGIFEPIGPVAEVTKEALDELKLFQQALKMYRAQDWDHAEVQLISLQNRYPQFQGIYRVYLDRIKRFRAEPPGDHWDGVFEFAHK